MKDQELRERAGKGGAIGATQGCVGALVYLSSSGKNLCHSSLPITRQALPLSQHWSLVLHANLNDASAPLIIFYNAPSCRKDPGTIRSGTFIMVDANKGFSAFKKCRRVERVRCPRCQEQRSDSG